MARLQLIGNRQSRDDVPSGATTSDENLNRGLAGCSCLLIAER
jgi:hypothetical protein